ncbi:MAG TPA: O-antigen ligase family protein [Pyrinomonadaceae bacterium]|nr:O-antigen ligase family protein [Pyrinomonadaceae bacterium]
MLKSPIILAACLCILACAVGIGVATVGSNSQAALIGVSAGILAVFGVIFILVYDLPLVFLTRIAFIASLFFKADVTILKIDELEDPSGLNISLTFICAAVLFLSDFYNRDETENKKNFPLLFSITLTALTICAAIAAFYGTNGKLGWFNFLSYLSSVFVCYIVASHFGKRERVKELVLGIACGVAFTGLTAISQFLVSFPKLPFLGTGTEEELLWTQAELFSRVSAFLRTPTEMGWVISALLPILVAPLIGNAKGFTKNHRLILAFSAILGVAAIILSLARGSWIALVAGTAIIIFCAWKNFETHERNKYFAAVGGLILLSAIALAPFGGRIYERLTTDDGESAAIRLPLMQVATNIIEANPLVGVGLSGYRTAMYRYDDTKEHVTQIFPGTVHNSFAHITAEIGIPGGIFFGILLLIAVFECWITMSSRDKLLFALALGAFAAIVAYTISAIKEPGGLGSTRPPVRTCFLLLGFVMALSNCRRNSISNSKFQIPD